MDDSRKNLLRHTVTINGLTYTLYVSTTDTTQTNLLCSQNLRSQFIEIASNHAEVLKMISEDAILQKELKELGEEFAAGQKALAENA